MSENYILDACAILALLKGETGANVVETLLMQAKNNLCVVYMSEYNLLEVYYGFYREDGEVIAEKRIQAILNSPISILKGFSHGAFKQAGRLKASYKISLADSVVLAEGTVRDGIIVSSDHHEFDVIEQSENIKFLWIR